jgi:serine phosphatase RsbU (regulator of sigma subunit)/anti-sigma regulatory factor (Ser/Thr protein kinase)
MTSDPQASLAPAAGASGNGIAWHWHGPATFPGVREAAIQARSWLAGAGVPEKDLFAWELLLCEAGNNVAEHCGTDAPLEIDLSILPGRIVARVTDHSAGFDWPDSISLPEADSESGRGLFLMEAMTTARDYLRGNHRNVLTLERAGEIPVPVPSPGPGSEDIEATLEAMTEELSACYESLSAIFRFTAESRQCTGLADFAGRLLQHLVTVTGADFGMLRAGSGDDLKTLAALGCEALAPQSPGPLEAAAIATRQDQWIEQDTFTAEDSPSGSSPRAGLVHPFYLDDELMGILSLGRRHSTQPLNAGEVNVVHTFAEFFTQQVLSRRHEEAAIQTSVARRELELAAEIQRLLLPRRLPVWPGISISGHCESALTVGGDFYDIIPWENRGFLFIVADVMGKGVGASMMAAVTRQAFRSLGQFSQSPAQVMVRAAALLFDDLDRLEMFVTVAIGVVDLQQEEVRIANAGHCPVLVAMPDGQVVSCEPSMPPLGLEKSPDCPEMAVPFTAGSRLVAYSDGLVDPRDERTPFRSPDDLSEWVGIAAKQSPTAESLKSALLERIGCSPSEGPSPFQADDQTILVIARNTTRELF